MKSFKETKLYQKAKTFAENHPKTANAFYAGAAAVTGIILSGIAISPVLGQEPPAVSRNVPNKNSTATPLLPNSQHNRLQVGGSVGLGSISIGDKQFVDAQALVEGKINIDENNSLSLGIQTVIGQEHKDDQMTGPFSRQHEFYLKYGHRDVMSLRAGGFMNNRWHDSIPGGIGANLAFLYDDTYYASLLIGAEWSKGGYRNNSNGLTNQGGSMFQAMFGYDVNVSELVVTPKAGFLHSRGTYESRNMGFAYGDRNYAVWLAGLGAGYAINEAIKVKVDFTTALSGDKPYYGFSFGVEDKYNDIGVRLDILNNQKNPNAVTSARITFYGQTPFFNKAP